MYFKSKFLLFIFFLSCTTSFAQNVEFEHITDRDGLINNSVTAIIKDSEGFMWFGTFNGLSRYDGYSFTHYVNDPKDKSSLSDNRIRFIFETKEKVLFIGH